MALCVVLCANATPLQGLKKSYQLLPSVAELATGIEKAPAATQGLQYDATAAINVTYNSLPHREAVPRTCLPMQARVSHQVHALP